MGEKGQFLTSFATRQNVLLCILLVQCHRYFGIPSWIVNVLNGSQVGQQANWCVLEVAMDQIININMARMKDNKGSDQIQRNENELNILVESSIIQPSVAFSLYILIVLHPPPLTLHIIINFNFLFVSLHLHSNVIPKCPTALHLLYIFKTNMELSRTFVFTFFEHHGYCCYIIADGR